MCEDPQPERRYRPKRLSLRRRVSSSLGPAERFSLEQDSPCVRADMRSWEVGMLGPLAISKPSATGSPQFS